MFFFVRLLCFAPTNLVFIVPISQKIVKVTQSRVKFKNVSFLLLRPIRIEFSKVEVPNCQDASWYKDLSKVQVEQR